MVAGDTELRALFDETILLELEFNRRPPLCELAGTDFEDQIGDTVLLRS